jgi:photosystem II stability/assembly factor-like uncharacterized protein
MIVSPLDVWSLPMIRTLTVGASSLASLVAMALACSDADTPVSPSVSALKRGTAPTLTPQQSGTTNRLQAISPVNARVAWGSGTGGTYVVTTNGGATWRAGVVPGAEDLEFRDVEGVSERVAYLMAAGPGEDSRIYKTTDGGAHWVLQFQNHNSGAFYDCFAFWDQKRGITFSDAVNGVFPAIRTTNGATWQLIGGRLPAAQDGEAAFAASGTCVAVQGGKRAWIATGGAARARVLATTDGGNSWTAYNTPITQGTPISGGISIAFRDPHHGILAGGDLGSSNVPTDNVAVSRDGGATWTLAAHTPFASAVYGLAYVPGYGQRTVVATGPAGAAWSSDEGGSWTSLPGVSGFWAVGFAGRGAGWLVGVNGTILKVSF